MSVLAVLSALCVLGQTNNARLEGFVQDSSGAVIAVAKVTATNSKTGAALSLVTSTGGQYTFPALQPGSYTLSVEAPGFQVSVVSDIELAVGDSVTQNVTLTVGAVTESVNVVANAISVQTSEAQTAQVLTMTDIKALPQLARTPGALAALMPGVVITPGGGGRVNGMRNGSNNTTLDGMYVSDPTAPSLGQTLTANNSDSVGEFRMVTSGSKAEYGYNAGANIQLITRSGTNKWSGNLYEYLRNTQLNANDFFNNSTRTARPKLIQNSFGGSIGGPIKRDKTFFFFNTQVRRTRQESSANRTVLTPSARDGIFTYRTPSSGALQTFSIPLNDPRRLGIDSTVAKNIALLPAANNFLIGDGLNTAGYIFNGPVTSMEDQLTFKADHNLTARNHLFARYNFQHTNSESAPTFPGQLLNASEAWRWSLVMGSDWVLSPSTVNEFRWIDREGFTDFKRPNRVAGAMFNTTLFTNPLDPAFSSGRGSPQKEITDNITWVKGKHTFKGGLNIRFFQLWSYDYAGVYPNVTFARANGNTVPTTIGPSGTAVVSSAARTIFEDMYNTLLGRTDQVTQTYYSDLVKFLPSGASRRRNHLTREAGFFFQDDWRVTRNLVLNLGLRYEYYGAPSEENNFIGAYSPSNLLSRTTTVPNLTVEPGKKWFNADLNNWAPRFGLAWDPRGDGKTSIRMHSGIFYDRTVSGAEVDIDGSMPGFSNTFTLFPNSAGTSDLRVGDGVTFPSVTGSPASLLTPANARQQSITVLNPNLRTGYVIDYGFSVQREVVRNTVLEVAYVGNRGIKLFLDEDINQSKITNGFLNSFKELQSFQATGTPLTTANDLVRIYGSAAAAVTAVGATNLTQGLVGTAANNLDRQNFSRYAAAGLPDNYLRNNTQFNQVIFGTNDGRSYYNSLQMSLTHRSGPLSVRANYTFSKSIDVGSGDGSGFSSPIDNFNLRLMRGISDQNRPHSFNGTVAYTLPVGRGQSFGRDLPKWADAMIGGWDLGSIIVLQSGAPFTVSSSRATAAIPGNTRANYSATDTNIGNIERRGDGVYFLSAAEIARFSFPTAGEIGNSPRNGFIGPRYVNFDASLVKKFKITERQSLNLRIEAYNVFNHATFSGLTTNLTIPATFGKFTSLAADPRIMQAALRFEF
ncbi:MAG: TonB-dependent receptor [Bryobacteraceae bacterium]